MNKRFIKNIDSSFQHFNFTVYLCMIYPGNKHHYTILVGLQSQKFLFSQGKYNPKANCNLQHHHESKQCFFRELKYLVTCAAALGTFESFLIPVSLPVLKESIALVESCLTVPALHCLFHVGMQIPQVDTWTLIQNNSF